MDASLLITVLVIFAATLLGSVLRGARRDRCLEGLDDYHVALQYNDGRVIWGLMHLKPTGLELTYQEDVISDMFKIKTSYIIYKDEYNKLQGLYRYASDLSADEQRRRNKAMRRAFHPGPVPYIARQTRNFVNTAADSLTEALNLVVGRSRVMSSELVLASGQSHLKGLTKDVLGYVGTSYDPLIESLVGAQVVVEVAEGDQWLEYSGVLWDYSASFLQMMDVEFAQMVRLVLCDEMTSRPAGDYSAAPQGLVTLWCGLEAVCERDLLIVRNHTEHDILLSGVILDEEIIVDKLAHDVAIRQGGEYRYALPHQVTTSLSVTVKTVRLLDMVLPRSRAIIRHRAERYEAADALDLRLQFESLWQRARGITEENTLALRSVQVDEADRRLSTAFAQRHGLIEDQDGVALVRPQATEQRFLAKKQAP